MRGCGRSRGMAAAGGALRRPTQAPARGTGRWARRTPVARSGPRVGAGWAAVGAAPAWPSPRVWWPQVSEFLNKGVGAAQLPRKGQDRKDKVGWRPALAPWRICMYLYIYIYIYIYKYIYVYVCVYIYI